MVKLLYESAFHIFKRAGEDPHYYLPKVTGDRASGYDFGRIRSNILVGTASGRGIGRSDRNDDVYCIELADWEASEAEDAIANLITSQPESGSNRFTVDFNANTNWVSSYAYELWENAHASGKGWNKFTPFFSGTDDFPEMYTPDFLSERAAALGPKRFRTDYPRVKEDLYVQRDTAVFDSDLIDAAVGRTGGSYSKDGVLHGVVHGVDTASGNPEGDYQSCITMGYVDGMWWELCEPLRERVPEDVFANMVHERIQEYGGVAVVERNVGSAVLVRLRELGTQNLYRHRHRDKDGKQVWQLGFPTTHSTKRQMIAQTQGMLRNGEIGLVTPWVIQEFKEFEWKTKDDGKEHTSLAGAPNRKNAHDDGVMAMMVGLQGIDRATLRSWAA